MPETGTNERGDERPGAQAMPPMTAGYGPSGGPLAMAGERTYAFGAPAFLTRRRLDITQLQDYRYSESVRDIVTRLRLLPPASRGWQRVADSELRAAPVPHTRETSEDPFGNRVVEFHHEQVGAHLTLVLALQAENGCGYDEAGRVVPTALPDRTALLPASVGGADAFLSPTRLTEPDDALRQALADGLGGEAPADPARDPFGFATALSRYIHREMRYVSGATGVSTTAAEAWSNRSGVCQDFAHLYLALSRLAGIPARYVSGFLPGEGAMHAWAEALLPSPLDGGRRAWYAIDPTHDAWADERYIAVAAGRDYADVLPNSGTYYGAAQSVLRHRSRVEIVETVTAPYPGPPEPDRE